MPRKLKFAPSKWEIGLSLFLLLLALALYGGHKLAWFQAGAQAVRAEIFYDNELKLVFPLQGEARSFSLPECPQVCFAYDGAGKIAFASSNCPDQICVNCGQLRLAGEAAACLPNKVVLSLVPDPAAANFVPPVVESALPDLHIGFAAPSAPTATTATATAPTSPTSLSTTAPSSSETDREVPKQDE